MRVSAQPGRAHPPSRRIRALRWAFVARRFRRPTASGSRSFSSIVTTVAPQSIRRTVAAAGQGRPRCRRDRRRRRRRERRRRRGRRPRGGVGHRHGGRHRPPPRPGWSGRRSGGQWALPGESDLLDTADVVAWSGVGSAPVWLAAPGLLLPGHAPAARRARPWESIAARNAAPSSVGIADLDRRACRCRPTSSRTTGAPRPAARRRRGRSARRHCRTVRSTCEAVEFEGELEQGRLGSRARRSASGRGPSSRTAGRRRTRPRSAAVTAATGRPGRAPGPRPGDRPHCQASQWAQDLMPTPCQPPRSSNSAISRSQAAVAAANRTAPAVIAAASSGSGLPEGCSGRRSDTEASFEYLFEG